MAEPPQAQNPIPSAEDVDASVKKSLEGTPYESSELTRLSGGSVNWTYAATLARPLGDGTAQVMVKHAEERMRARPETVLPVDRATREIACFKRLSESPVTGETDDQDASSRSITVRTPKYHHFDEANSNQLLEYMPKSITLKDYILKYYSAGVSESSEPEARQIGKSLGSWLKGFTQWSANHADLAELAAGNELGRYFRHFVSFGWLRDRVEGHPEVLGDVKEVFEKVEQTVAADLNDPSKVQVIHGDFWPGNILLPDAPMAADGNTTLFVIDWEMMHMNVPNVDLGIMTGELYALWLTESVPAALLILEAVVEAYGPVTEASAFRTAIQIGAHLVSVIGEHTESVIPRGRDIIVNAWNKDRAWFEKGELACLFRQAK